MHVPMKRKEPSRPRAGVWVVALFVLTLGARVLALADESDPSLSLTYNHVALTNGQVRLAISYHTDSSHNYVVEFQDELAGGICTRWQPLPNAPHNYGIV